MNDYSDIVDGFEDICRRTHDLPSLLGRAETDQRPDLVAIKELIDFGSLALAIPEDAGGVEMYPLGLAAIGVVAGRYLLPIHLTNAMFVAAPALAGGADEEIRRLLEHLVGGELSAAVGFVADDSTGSSPRAKARRAWVPSDAELLVTAQPNRLTVHRLDDSWNFIDVAGLDPGQGLQLLTDPPTDVGQVLALDGAPAARIWQLWQLGIAAQALGCARHLLQESVAYAKQREQFGVPIASFQAVAHRLADMYVAVAAGESMLSRTAHSLESGDADATTDLASLTHWLPAAARTVCEQAIQVHGGTGFTWELGLHLYYRRVLTVQSILGGNRGSARRVTQTYLHDPGPHGNVTPVAGAGA